MRGTGRAMFAAIVLLMTYGRVIGITGASLGAISAVLSIGGADPWWSLAVFALCIYIIHGLFILVEDERAVAS
jgi:hypothetical protein